MLLRETTACFCALPRAPEKRHARQIYHCFELIGYADSYYCMMPVWNLGGFETFSLRVYITFETSGTNICRISMICLCSAMRITKLFISFYLFSRV